MNIITTEHICLHTFKDICAIISLNQICINIRDYSNEKHNEQFIWLMANTDAFQYFTLSRDCVVLLVIVIEHNVLLYNTVSGNVINNFITTNRNGLIRV